MKNLINKIKAFVKKNYIACTVVGSLILVIIASIIIVGLIKSYKNRIELSTEKHSFYQYFDVTRNDFYAKISLENNKIVDISSQTYNVYNNSPIYYVEKDSIIVPKESSIIFYYRENLSYRLPKYSKLTLDDGASKISSNGNEEAVSGFFIYDGVDTYIIPKKSTLNINGGELTLGEYSYVIANQNYVTYYDYATKIANKIENIEKATLTFDEVAIDLLKDVTVVNSKVGLLETNVSSLEVYLED